MRIAAYIRPENLVNPTGVGKHQINIVKELSRLSDLVLLVPMNPDMDSVKREYGNIPVRMIPFPRKILEFLMIRTNLPLLDKYLPEGTDRLYFPYEMSVRSKKAKIAMTVHCVNWFEESLSWYHDPDTVRARGRLSYVFKRCLDRADNVLTVSGFLKERINAIFRTNMSKISVVGNGAEHDFFDIADRQRNQVSDPIILVVAALTDRKGARYVISAAREMKSVMPSARFVIANGACGTDGYISEAISIGNVELLGYTQGSEVVKLMAKTSALLILSEYESFGIPAIEAMASGVPVVGANFAALPEVIGDAGIIVKADDPGEVCKALYNIITDKDRRDRLSAKGIERAKEFTWKRCAERLVNALKV